MSLDILEFYPECSCFSIELVARHLAVTVLYLLCRPPRGVSVLKANQTNSFSARQTLALSSSLRGSLFSVGITVTTAGLCERHPRLPQSTETSAPVGVDTAHKQGAAPGQETTGEPSLEARRWSASTHRLSLTGQMGHNPLLLLFGSLPS